MDAQRRSQLIEFVNAQTADAVDASGSSLATHLTAVDLSAEYTKRTVKIAEARASIDPPISS